MDFLTQLKPYLKQVAKYHFWLLAILMPLVLVPLAFTADAKLLREIDTRQAEIQQQIDSIDGVTRYRAPGFEDFSHPQQHWGEQVEAATNRIRQGVLKQWTQFWDEQQSLRSWPTELGGDFIAKAKALGPDDSLPTRLLERYQNTVRRLVRKLPERIDAAEEMADETLLGGTGRGPRSTLMDGLDVRDGLADEQYTVLWDATDQSELYASYSWMTTPSTKQVLLAQEELRCYDLLCSIIAEANKDATGSHDATVAIISTLAAGYRATEDNPGGRNGGRIQTAQSGGDDFMDMGMDMGMGMDMEGEGGRPSNPRFATSGTMAGMENFGDPLEFDMEMMEEDNDAELLNWIYVDRDGTPLLAEDVEMSPDTKMTHLVPFVFRGEVDQRKLDLLLRIFANQRVPIDVRQLRINPDGGMLGNDEFGGSMPSPRSASLGGEGASTRKYDLDVELRGTIALATRPDPEYLGLDLVENDNGAMTKSDNE